MEKVLACFVLALLADVSASSGFGCVPDASGKEVALVRGVRNWNFLSNTARNMTSWIHQVELKRPSRESPFSTCRLRKELVQYIALECFQTPGSSATLKSSLRSHTRQHAIYRAFMCLFRRNRKYRCRFKRLESRKRDALLSILIWLGFTLHFEP